MAVASHLVRPTRSSDDPGRVSLPIWPCSDWGLPCHDRYRSRGGLLPHLFTLTRKPGGLFSVALSVALRRPGVTWQSALRSSDFPRAVSRPRPAVRPRWESSDRPSPSPLSPSQVLPLLHEPPARAARPLLPTVPRPG